MCETRARSCRVHPGKRKRVCKSELYTAYTREHIHVRQKWFDRIDSRIRRGTSLLPAAEIIFGHRATRAARDICHAYAYALLQLHVVVCLWSWAVCAWSLIGSHHDRQSPRAVMSYVAPVSYRTRTVRVPIMIPVPAWYSRYWCMRITRGQVAGPADRADPTQVICAKDLDHTDPTLDHTDLNQANMCERSRSCRSHLWNMI